MKAPRLLYIALFAATAACSAKAPPPKASVDTDRGPLTDVPHDEMPAPETVASDASFAERLAILAEHHRVTSKGVGYAGEKSASYTAYESLVKTASVDELRPLLGHESAVVRAYIAGHLAVHDPESVTLLSRTLADATSVNAQYGCMRTDTTVADHLANQLCFTRNFSVNEGHAQAAEQLLASAAKDPASPANTSASHCLSR